MLLILFQLNALKDLSVIPDQILVDGLDKPDTNIETKCIVKGDSKVDSIMSASIIAKVTRDQIVVHYSKIFFEYGFERVNFVSQPGEFSVRGGIIDVFSFSNQHPYRIEFFDQDIESLRSFDVNTQLSISSLD